jgi:hypothetical protein
MVLLIFPTLVVLDNYSGSDMIKVTNERTAVKVEKSFTSIENVHNDIT